MDSRKLNQKVKRLWKEYQTLNDNLNSHKINMAQWTTYINTNIGPKFLRIMHDGDNFRGFNRKSILILIIFNRKFGFLKQFRFGLNIDERDL